MREIIARYKIFNSEQIRKFLGMSVMQVVFHLRLSACVAKLLKVLCSVH